MCILHSPLGRSYLNKHFKHECYTTRCMGTYPHLPTTMTDILLLSKVLTQSNKTS